MVKDKKPSEVCLNPRFPCARQYEHGNIFEQVTVPDVSPSLYKMVTTGMVGSITGNARNFSYPDLEEDEELAHDHPDYEKLNHLDNVEKEAFVEDWLHNPKNYEKRKEEPPKEDQKDTAKGGSDSAQPTE